MPTVFEVLADPGRRRIVELLRQREHSVGELAELLRVAQPNVSKHLRTLRAAGFVDVRIASHHRFYSLRPQPFAELDAWLRPFRELWADRLDALERHLDTMEDR